MADTEQQIDVNEVEATEPPSPGDALEDLRRLLLGREQEKIGAIEQRLDEVIIDAKNVGGVLPEAITIRAAQDEDLATALAPTIEQAIRTSVRKDPQPLVDAISPVMGPAIRRSIYQALRQLVQSFNTALTHSLSLRAIQWRWEALRTGKPFAEIVLLHTLLYRVEQVFLIHRVTGLLLRNEVAESVTVRDEDMFSAMLTAIQDFVRDSLGSGADEALETLQMGELTVWVEQGPHAVLAGVIRGNAPQEVRSVFREALEAVHLQVGGEIETFEGDTAPFEACGPHLRECLVQAQQEAEKRRRSPLLWIIPAVVLVLLGVWGFFRIRDGWRWGDYLERLEAEPGIVVTRSGRDGGKYFVTGLRDPLAKDPAKMLGQFKIEPDTVVGRWKTYLAFEPELILRRADAVLQPPKGVSLRLDGGVLHASGAARREWIRQAAARATSVAGVDRYADDGLAATDEAEYVLAEAKAVLAPPDTVRLTFDGGVLTAAGSAAHQWIVSARSRARSVPGVARYEDTGVADDDVKGLGSLRDRIEKRQLHFPTALSDLIAAERAELARVAADIQALAAAAKTLGMAAQVEISGHCDASGSEESNLRLSHLRAAHVVSALVGRGVPAAALVAVAKGSGEPFRPEVTERDRALNRRVSFRVLLEKTPDE